MIALLVSAVLAVGAASIAQEAEVPADARATIAAANAAWVAALKAQDALAVAAPYADDGIFVTATGAIVKGRTGVAQLMRDRFAQTGRVVNGEIVQDGVTRQGSLIYEWGHATLELGPAGAPPVRSGGRYLTVWRKSGAGHWEIIRNLSLPE